jgi:hypothetical protein
MTEPSMMQWSRRTKVAVSLSVSAGVLLVVLANVHLVYVATISQPDCVAHVRQGEGGLPHRPFSAAQSSCSPRSIAQK